MKKFVGVIAGLIVATGMAFGQTSKGTLVGVARDATGAVLSGATVTITDEATGAVRTEKTTALGAFRFDALDPGPYTIVTSNPGFDTSKVKSVRVDASVVTSYDVNVKVGSAADVVSIDADTVTLDTENGQIAGVINRTEIEKLPIFSENPYELALTVPGVQPLSQGTFGQGQEYTVNGSRPRANNFLLDGQEVNDVAITGQSFQPQIPDVTESVTAIVNSGDAEYGRAGGAVVNMTTRSGTNIYHGSVFERYTGSGLNSTPGIYRGTAYNQARFNEHSYGFTAGGPIFKDKLFVFGGLILQRSFGNATPGINLLPDAAGYAALQTFGGPGVATQVGLFDSYLSNGVYLTQDKIYYQKVSGTVAPLTPVTTQTVGGVTGPNCGGSLPACTVTFSGFQRPNVPLNNPDTQWMYRVDYHPWEKDSFAFRYLHNRSSRTPDFLNSPNALLGFDTQQGGPSELGEGMYTHVFTPHLLNEFRASEERVSFKFQGTPDTLANPLNFLASMGLSGISGTSSAGFVSLPTLGPNQNFPQGRSEDYYQFQDTVTYSHGRNTIRAGVDIGRLIEIEFVSQNAIGTLNFVAGGTGQTALGNFLLNQLGPSGTATKTFGPTRVDAHGYRNGIFAQDDIKLTSSLTVNLGFRWDYLTDPENNLSYPGLDPNNLGNPINTYVRIKPDYHDYSPRVGFAYSPRGIMGKLGDGKTVIRGGFGVFYDSTFSNILVNSAQSSPNAVSGFLQQVLGNGLPNATGLIPSITPNLSPLSSVLSEVNNFVNPITSQYNLGIQRELPGQISLDIRYVGNNSSNLYSNQQYNYTSGLTGQRLNPARGPISARGNYGVSNYNSLQISGEHKFRQGLLIKTNYVYGKNLSTADEIFQIGAPSSYAADLSVNGHLQDYGNSSYDHRQFFSVSYVYSPKGLHSSKMLADGALGLLTRHWTVSGVTQLQSGEYTTILINGLDINGDGTNTNDRAVISNPTAPLTSVGVDGTYLKLTSTAGTYYDLGQYNATKTQVTAPASQFHYIVPVGLGNQFLSSEIGRNSLLHPGSTTNNIALEKGFGLSYLHLSRGNVILRAEGQNVFNHNDNVVGDSSIRDINAGYNTTSRANTQRVLILWAKINF